jgi:hypothetical protein
MMPVTDATCEGFNQFKTDQKANPGESLMTLTLFDTTFDTRFVGTSLDDIPDLGLITNSYNPGGMTALFDAVGESIKKTERWVKEHKWTDRVMVVTLTDGQENSSIHWHVRNPRTENDAFDVAGLIDWKQKEGWDFVFLGAGGTDWLERTFQNLPQENFFAYAGDAGSTRQAYATMDSAITRSRTTGQTLSSSLTAQTADPVTKDN